MQKPKDWLILAIAIIFTCAIISLVEEVHTVMTNPASIEP